MLRFRSLWMMSLCVVSLGCGSSEKVAETSKPSAAAEKYLLPDEPHDAQSVMATKESAKDGEEVTLVGRIGGSESPFVNGRAAFTLVDTSLVPCSEREGDSCQTPWDYCCDTDALPKATAVVKVVDEAGQTISLDAKKDLGLKELQTIVVRGKAKRDEAGNLTVTSPAIFVKK
jgi:hypothetical protein